MGGHCESAGAFGHRTAGRVVVALLATVALSLALPVMAAPALQLGWLFLALTAAIGIGLLLVPGWQLMRVGDGRLFDHASFYPLSMLALITAFVLPG